MPKIGLVGGEVEVTEVFMKAGRSIAGSWNRPQLELLGVTWPLEKGWRRRLVGGGVMIRNPVAGRGSGIHKPLHPCSSGPAG